MTGPGASGSGAELLCGEVSLCGEVGPGCGTGGFACWVTAAEQARKISAAPANRRERQIALFTMNVPFCHLLLTHQEAQGNRVPRFRFCGPRWHEPQPTSSLTCWPADPLTWQVPPVPRIWGPGIARPYP
jgi:hypothetical protein